MSGSTTAELPDSPSSALATPERPWLGLAAFTEECREYFYGRDAEIHELTDRVRRAPVTILYGVSGYGKSSIIGAGLIPALRESGHRIVFLRRCYDDLAERSLTADIIAAVAAAIPGTVSETSDVPVTLWEFFHDRRQPWITDSHDDDESASGCPVLILDQFEEIFVKGEDRSTGDATADERARRAAQAFLHETADLVENRPPDALRERLHSGTSEEKRALIRRYHFTCRPVHLALALREDYLARLERWRREMPALMEHRIELRPLSGPQAFRAVFEPGARREGQPPIIPRDVAESIVRAAAGAGPEMQLDDIATVPPILSLLCERLNNRRLAAPVPAASITTTDFAPGEASRILGSFYEEKTNPHPRALCDYLEDELVSSTGLRETVTLASALAALGTIKDAGARLRSLVDDRILVIEERHGIARLELTHDTLAQFALERRSQRHARLRRRRAMAWAAAALVIAGISTGLAVWALQERGHARQKTVEANTALAQSDAQLREASRSDAATAQARLADGKWQEALAYLGRAVRYDPENRNAQDALWLAVRYGQPDAGRLPKYQFPHKSGVNSASFSPGGSHLVTASEDGTAQVWDTKTGQPVGESMKHAGGISSAIFSPDGKYIVTAGQDNFARCWHGETGLPAGEDMTHERAVLIAVFNTGSDRIFTAGLEKMVRIWSVPPAREFVAALSGHTDKLRGADISPKGTLIATSSEDSTARLWDADTGEAVGVLPHAGSVFAVHFSPDGRHIVTACKDGSARLWEGNETTWGPLGVPMVHSGPVRDVSFSPDGTRVVTASDDGTARLWDSNSGLPAAPPMRHAKKITRVSFSPDGSRILTASDDKTARLWEAKTGLPIGAPFEHEGEVFSARFSPDGSLIVTAGKDSVAQLWTADSGKVVYPEEEAMAPAVTRPLPGADSASVGKIHTITSRDQARKVIITLESTAELQTGRGDHIASLQHQDSITTADFSPDGKRIVTGSFDRTIRVWDALTGALIYAAKECRSAVEMARFSPDGARIATASGGMVQLWDAHSGLPIGPELELSGKATSMVWNGSKLTAVREDGGGRTWVLRPDKFPGRDLANRLGVFLGGARLDPLTGTLQGVSFAERMALRESLATDLAGFPEWRLAVERAVRGGPDRGRETGMNTSAAATKLIATARASYPCHP